MKPVNTGMQLSTPGQTGAGAGLRAFVESRGFNLGITAVIVVNALSLGLETSARVVAAIGPLLNVLDQAALLVFTTEIAMRLWVYRVRFFTRGWNLFDFIIIAVSWIPAAGAFSVLRAMRILRVMRLMSIVPQMRMVVGALFNALPGMGSIVAVLLLVFYVSAVMATQLFGLAFPQWFGSIGASMYSLFQIMTLESWSMGIVRPIMEVYPHAWVFFVPFVIVTSFAVLNLFIALIVNSMQLAHLQDKEEATVAEELAHDERIRLMESVQALRDDVQNLQQLLTMNQSPGQK
jgi:voltage-gated sodium channel